MKKIVTLAVSPHNQLCPMSHTHASYLSFVCASKSGAFICKLLCPMPFAHASWGDFTCTFIAAASFLRHCPPPFWALFAHPSLLQCLSFVPCLLHTPPFTELFVVFTELFVVHPSLRHFFLAPCLVHTPPLTIIFVHPSLLHSLRCSLPSWISSMMGSDDMMCFCSRQQLWLPTQLSCAELLCRSRHPSLSSPFSPAVVSLFGAATAVFIFSWLLPSLTCCWCLEDIIPREELIVTTHVVLDDSRRVAQSWGTRYKIFTRPQEDDDVCILSMQHAQIFHENEQLISRAR